jgi:hypothetical protein
MSRERKCVPVTIDEELLLALRQKAAATDRSVADLIEETIAAALAEDRQHEPPRQALDAGAEIVASVASVGSGGSNKASYLAFISYSHADEKIAAATHRLLEGFRVPRSLIGQETPHGKVPERIRPVFRDREEFPASADLGRTIREALAAARTLVVICSPRSAHSRWVGEEIRHFKQLGRAQHIYCLLADGDAVAASQGASEQASLHPALLERFDAHGEQLAGTQAEPLAVSLGDGGLATAGIKLAAGILGVGYDDLHQRVRRQRLRNRSILAGIVAAILATGSWLLVDGWQEKRLNLAQQLAAQAREIYSAQPLPALALALHAMAIAPQHDEATWQAIAETARQLAARGRIANLGKQVEKIIASADGSRLAVDHAEAVGELRSGNNGALLEKLAQPISRVKFLDPAPGYLVTDYRWSRADLRRAASGALVAQLKSPVADVSFGAQHFFVRYSGGHANELRRLDDGRLVPLAEGVRADRVAFSNPATASLLSVLYLDGQRPELRRGDDASVVRLTGKPSEIQFSLDVGTTRIIVAYEDAPTELLRTANLSMVRRFARDAGRLFSLRRDGKHFLRLQHDATVTLLRGSDGSALAAGSKIVRSGDGSFLAVLAADRVQWFRASDGERVGVLSADSRGGFKALKFSQDPVPTRLAIRRDDTWQLRAVDDGLLIAELPDVEAVDLDREYFFIRGQQRAEIRRLSDGAVVLSLAANARAVSYPSPGLVQVRLDDDARQLRRLSDGSVVRTPSNRSIESATLVGPGSEYELIRYTGSKSELKRSTDGSSVLQLGEPGAALLALTFIPNAQPSHVLARYEDGSSSLIALQVHGESVRLSGSALSVDLLSAKAPRYLIIRYDDGRAEIWRGLHALRRLAALDTNLQGFSLANGNAHAPAALTVWYADGHADVIDLDWLARATADETSDQQLFALACLGPLAGFEATQLADRLGGEPWRGCSSALP